MWFEGAGQIWFLQIRSGPWGLGLISLRGSPLVRVKAVVVDLALARSGRLLWLLVWVDGRVLSAVRVWEDNGCTASTARCRGDGGARLHRRCCLNLGGAEMRGTTDENPVWFWPGRWRWQPWVSFPSLEASPSVSPSPSLACVGNCLRAKALIQCWVGTVAASSTSFLCWEHRAGRHGRKVLCCAPPVFAAAHDRSSPAQCTVVAGDSKMAPSLGQSSPAILLPPPLGTISVGDMP